MTNEERRIRMEVALEIMNEVYSDCCCDREISREETRDFCDFIIDTRKFIGTMFDKPKK